MQGCKKVYLCFFLMNVQILQKINAKLKYNFLTWVCKQLQMQIVIEHEYKAWLYGVIGCA